jgi:hypothetical protein
VSTNIAAEFNPSNPSYHNVLGLSVGMRSDFNIAGQAFSWGLPAKSAFLKGNWTYDSKVTCTDCHTSGSASAAKGPHGSSVAFGIDPDYPVDWTSAMLDRDEASGVYGNAQIICAKCHNLQNSNNVHNSWGLGSNQPHGHSWGSQCRGCHTAIPHGWKRPRLLTQVSDPAPYNQIQYGYSRWLGIQGVVIRSHGPTGWVSSDCQAGCTSYLSHSTPKANMMP